MLHVNDRKKRANPPLTTNYSFIQQLCKRSFGERIRELLFEGIQTARAEMPALDLLTVVRRTSSKHNLQFLSYGVVLYSITKDDKLTVAEDLLAIGHCRLAMGVFY